MKPCREHREGEGEGECGVSVVDSRRRHPPPPRRCAPPHLRLLLLPLRLASSAVQGKRKGQRNQQWPGDHSGCEWPCRGCVSALFDCTKGVH